MAKQETTRAYQEGLERGTTYNGWANRSTWLAVSWLTNDEATYEALREIALSDRTLWAKEMDVHAYLFELTLGELAPSELMHGLAADLVGQELREVDYQAIIESVEE
jgi:hypothetical protein